MNKIKIVGLRNIPFDGGLDPQKDYLVEIRAALDEIRTKTSQGEEDEEQIYVLKAMYIERIDEIDFDQSVKKISIRKGWTPSQQLRFAILDYFKRAEIEQTEEKYEEEMQKIIRHYNNKAL